MTVMDMMDSITEAARHRAEDWRDSGQALLRRFQAWRDSASEKLHPCLRYPLLALIDAIYWCSVGIGLLALLLLGLVLLCAFFFIVMAPFLVVGSWLSAYLLPPVDRAFRPSLYMRHVIFALASALLFGIVYKLNELVKSQNPDQNLADLLSNFTDGLALLPWMLVTYALWIAISACCVVLTYDITLAGAWGFVAVSFCLYYFFFFCYLLIRHIPWYVLLPLVVLLPLFFISLLRRVKSDPRSDDGEQPYDPPESMYGEVQSCALP
ncbi:hypothetical protein MPTK1_1g17940 [Marchantia polymorpha subsp. ruderalis]|uniref:Uncharacterized protein n=1 Tax=Marchantia polymorpha subsp. ruderalis TaxID=1480154 RepID=A0AAF6ARD7_MARPO|nr:hypothetical protein Mp_1g17940 [Marchantia polymorpha subsp. ruderalis]